MLCDAQAQYGDYSELDMCPMWGMWEKEGGELDKGPMETVGDKEKGDALRKSARSVGI